MNREDLSRPPSDAALLHDIVHDVLSGFPSGSTLPVSVLLRTIREQCPETVEDDDIVRAIVEGIKALGFAVQFDEGP